MDDIGDKIDETSKYMTGFASDPAGIISTFVTFVTTQYLPHNRML